MSKLQRLAEIRQAWQIVMCQVSSDTMQAFTIILTRDRHRKGNLMVQSLRCLRCIRILGWEQALPCSVCSSKRWGRISPDRHTLHGMG